LQKLHPPDGIIMTELSNRVEKLEQENRRLKRIGLAAAVVMGLAALLGQARPQPKEIKAQSFVVVDEQDRTRATLGLDDDGVGLTLRDAAGRPVAQLQVAKTPDKAALYMRDPKESSGVELAMTMNGPVLHLADKTGPRVRLATNELNAPLAAVYDAEGKKLFEVTANK
jgi:hypothetical protein